jgi:hypothetical protein
VVGVYTGSIGGSAVAARPFIARAQQAVIRSPRRSCRPLWSNPNCNPDFGEVNPAQPFERRRWSYVVFVWSCTTQGAARGTNNQLIGLRFHDRLRFFIYNIWRTPEGVKMPSVITYSLFLLADLAIIGVIIHFGYSIFPGLRHCFGMCALAITAPHLAMSERMR